MMPERLRLPFSGSPLTGECSLRGKCESDSGRKRHNGAVLFIDKAVSTIEEVNSTGQLTEALT